MSTGKTSIVVNYDIATVRNPYDGGSNTRINEVTLQYRVGTSGSFTTLSGPGLEYQNNTTTQTGSGVTTPQNLQSKSVTLPAACDNQPVVQIRWASRQVSGELGVAADHDDIGRAGLGGPPLVARPHRHRTPTLASATTPRYASVATSAAVARVVGSGATSARTGDESVDGAGGLRRIAR